MIYEMLSLCIPLAVVWNVLCQCGCVQSPLFSGPRDGVHINALSRLSLRSFVPSPAISAKTQLPLIMTLTLKPITDAAIKRAQASDPNSQRCLIENCSKSQAVALAHVFSRESLTHLVSTLIELIN